jgi:hypothetical protein
MKFGMRKPSIKKSMQQERVKNDIFAQLSVKLQEDGVGSQILKKPCITRSIP